MRFLLILMMVVSGFFVSFQGPINARLRLAVESPALGATISFLTGTLLLLCLFGWFGLEKTPFNPLRLLGLGLVLVGVLLVQKK